MEDWRGFVVRITRNDVLNRIYGERIYFVELRRDWSKGLKLIFMKKTSDTDYRFIGSGTIERIIHPEKLNSAEKSLCVKNNCYRKIVFKQLTKFFPAINVRHTMGRTWNVTLLHGMKLSASDILTIENLAPVAVES